MIKMIEKLSRIRCWLFHEESWLYVSFQLNHGTSFDLKRPADAIGRVYVYCPVCGRYYKDGY
jgi:hypothetical protein